MSLVVFLRGVNVGGHRTFRPSILAARLKHLGITNIGAAGTFVVRESVSQESLREQIAGQLPFETEIMICQGAGIRRLISRDPLAGQSLKPDMVRFLSIAARSPGKPPELPLDIPQDQPWHVRIVARDGRYFFGIYRKGMHAVRYLGKLDSIIGARVTTRNWNTLAEIARVLDAG